MKYMGSKNRHAKDLLAVMRPALNKAAVFVEPFCGGCNITDKLQMPRQASDSHPELIALWQAVSKGWLPVKNYTEKDYRHIRDNPTHYPPYERAYVGFALSYGGKWWGGWCRDSQGRRNYVEEARNNALKQFPLLKNVAFSCCSYTEVEIPVNAVVYCDPPYEGATGYGAGFNHNAFWQWAEAITVPVFVSSYTARPGWKRVWSKAVASSLTKDTGERHAVEGLWTK